MEMGKMRKGKKEKTKQDEWRGAYKANGENETVKKVQGG